MITEKWFSWLRRKQLAVPTDEPQPNDATISNEWLAVMTASELLATPGRQRLLHHIWQRTAVSRAQFDLLYLHPIERYAALVQQFPASESHHHSYSGGMLDHGLEIVAYALKLRQSQLLPAGSSPETQTAQDQAWTAAAAYAALLHDIGKIAVDIDVQTADAKTWHPWHGPLTQPYRFRYRPQREYRLHSAATGLLYTQILNPEILDWLSTFPALWSALLYVLAGQMEHAGMLAELVTKADQASVAQAMGGDPTKALLAPKHALQRKLLDGLRFLVKEKLKINQPQASDGWLTGEGLWLVSKTVSDKLRAHLLSQGTDGIPQSNNAVFDVLQEHGIAQPSPNGKVIWKTTITSQSGWSNTLTVFKVAPALIWDAGERPQSFQGEVVVVADDASTLESTSLQTDSHNPSQQVQAVAPITTSAVQPVQADSLEAVLDLLGPSLTTDTAITDEQDSSALHKTKSLPAENSLSSRGAPLTPDSSVPPDPSDEANLQDNITPSGEHFMVWLKDAILSRKLMINDAQAMVHTVADTVFLVSPSLFVRYAHEFTQCAKLAKTQKMPDWEWVQREFEKLKKHKKQPNGLNIWTCKVSGPRKTRQVHGYLLLQPELVIPDIPFNNPYLSIMQVSQE